MGCSSSVLLNQFCLSAATTRAIGGWQYQDSLDSADHGPIATACLFWRGSLYVAGSEGLAWTVEARSLSRNPRDGRQFRFVDKVANRAAARDGGSALYLKEYRREGPEVCRLFVAGGRGLATYKLKPGAQAWYPEAAGEVLSLETMVDRGGASMVATSSGDILYVAGSNGISILDLSKESCRITHVADLWADDVGAFRGVRSLQLALVEDRVLYAAGGRGLRVFDVSRLREPKKVGAVIKVASLTTRKHEGGAAMLVVGNRLILSGCGGLAFFEISDALRPRKVGDGIVTGVTRSYESGSLVADEEMLAVAGGNGLVVISLARPGLRLGPLYIGVLCGGCSSCMVLQGDHLYITGHAVAVLDWALLKCALHGKPPYDYHSHNDGDQSHPTASGSAADLLNAAISKTGFRGARAGGERRGAVKGNRGDDLETVVRASQLAAPALLLIDETASDAMRNEQLGLKHSSLQPDRRADADQCLAMKSPTKNAACVHLSDKKGFDF